jgi:hypothetical protein
MCKPAGYPLTDAAENAAHSVLLGKLDALSVKADIRTRDKVPNVDGTIEIVDKEQRPIGKFDIQLKKIPANIKRYDCPAELYAYSKVSSLPVFLLVVDVENSLVMWRHIYQGMPEHKEGQKTFTIKFTDDDRIDDSGIYLQQWASIALDYNERIQQYPELRYAVDTYLELVGINDENIKWFQLYAKELNGLLDNDFQCIKSKLMPPTCCLGVGISEESAGCLTYQHQLIEVGSKHPLIYRIDANSVIGEDNIAVVSQCWARRESMGDPRSQALDYLKREIESALNKYLFTIHGEDVAAEVISYFIQNYPRIFCMDVSKSYEIKELRKAYYQSLPASCMSYCPIQPEEGSIITTHIDLSQMECELKYIPPYENNMGYCEGVIYRLDNMGPPIQLFEDSLRFLINKGINHIEPRWLNPGRRQGRFIWSYSDKKILRSNLRILFQRLIINYSQFCIGNDLRMTQSPYLNPNTTIVFDINDNIGDTLFDGPKIHESHIRNEDLLLPKVIVVFRGDGGRVVYGDRTDRTLYIDEKPYAVVGWSRGDLSWPFHECPCLNGIYKLLTLDINRQYGYSFFSRINFA